MSERNQSVAKDWCDIEKQISPARKRRIKRMVEAHMDRMPEASSRLCVRQEVSEEAMRDLKLYRRTGRAVSWSYVKGKLGCKST